MRFRVLPSALNDLASGRIFYEQQGGEALGEYFFNSLFSDIDSLMLYAGIHARVEDYYRLLSKRFPYAIYYKVAGNDVEVWRVLDCRQAPDAIWEKLK